MSEPVSSIGTLILILIGILVTYYCRRNGFMVSQSLVFINFAVFAAWWIMLLLQTDIAIQSLIELGFQPVFLQSDPLTPQDFSIPVVVLREVSTGSVSLLP